MMQEAGSDNSFEIIDNKSISPKPEPAAAPATGVSAIPMYNPGNLGNLLSSVPPPTALPNFVAAAPLPQTSTTTALAPSAPMAGIPPMPTTAELASLGITEAKGTTGTQQPVGNFYPTTFSAAIPPNKGTAVGISMATTDIPLDTGYNYDDESQGGIFGWMKGAVASGGILSKVAEKAKSSVDSMITTLDPQMREFIYSGGDLELLVASDREDVISPIREAFQLVFGRATVLGRPAPVQNVAAQLVGFKDAISAANARISSIHNQRESSSIPTIAVESFLFQMDEDKWFDMDVLVLNDPSTQILLETYTQMTTVPSAIVTLAMSETSEQYPFKSSGLAVKIGTLLANNLQVPSYEWHEAVTGVSRRTLLLNAAKALAGLYKSVSAGKL